MVKKSGSKKKKINLKSPKKIIKKINLKSPKKTVKKIKLLNNKKSIDAKSTKTIIKEKISTGIPELDKLISGGFIAESINLVEGGSGSGKSILAMQYLLEGLRKGESTMYVTFEEKKENFYKNMKKLGWDLEKEEKSKKFIFLEYSPEKIKMMLDEGGGAIESLVLRNKVKRIVIDSITSFSLLYDNLLEKRGANIGFFDIIRKWKCTTLFTVQYDPSTTKKKDISLLEFEVDGIILLYFEKINNRRKRSLEIIKMRGTEHSTDMHSFTINHGIKINTTPQKTISKKTKKSVKQNP